MRTNLQNDNSRKRTRKFCRILNYICIIFDVHCTQQAIQQLSDSVIIIELLYEYYMMEAMSSQPYSAFTLASFSKTQVRTSSLSIFIPIKHLFIRLLCGKILRMSVVLKMRRLTNLDNIYYLKSLKF